MGSDRFIFLRSSYPTIFWWFLLSIILPVGSWDRPSNIVFQNCNFIWETSQESTEKGTGGWFLTTSLPSVLSHDPIISDELRGGREMCMIPRLSPFIIHDLRPPSFPSLLTPTVIAPSKVPLWGNISLLLNRTSSSLHSIALDERWHPPVGQVICWQKNTTVTLVFVFQNFSCKWGRVISADLPRWPAAHQSCTLLEHLAPCEDGRRRLHGGRGGVGADSSANEPPDRLQWWTRAGQRAGGIQKPSFQILSRHQPHL